jgi:hypothetical protein
MVAGSEHLLLLAIGNRVRAEHPYVVEGLPDDILKEMVERGVKTARSYGLSASEALATFVLLMFEFGPEFHRHPEVQAMLTDPAMAPEARLEAVIERTPSETWEHIQSAIHRQTWFPELREPDGD